ncbi:IspD/TarI family cytidylyltransferase [Psittacicella hinzii]|uniref:2-C-methyl-D-erythritol 4-phosphate cytidylyltransferase n=1 Tax=Psittacicella hinzii TaxID=2028575 RepID=A0A3A1YJI4_9GAMM|nr:2-C-methyl-D-erythritol 4-phosphate cytidylyltransferase [Psittacicella hinzii]RIY37825.1 hypothetical protein CKF58_04660 [Psittacicella hinzii]
MAKKYLALICAAGVGTRMQSQVPKQYLSLTYENKQQPILGITIQKFLAVEDIDSVLVALNENDSYASQLLPAWFDSFTAYNLKGKLYLYSQTNSQVKACLGYGERIHTVYSLLANAMQLCLEQDYDPAQTYVLIHDAARVGIKSSDIQSIIHACSTLDQIDHLEQLKVTEQSFVPEDPKIDEKDRACPSFLAGILPGMRCTDSVKLLQADNQNLITDNLDRKQIYLAQTPQTFNLLYFYYLLSKLLMHLDEPSLESKTYFSSYSYFLTYCEQLQLLEKSKIAELKFVYNNKIKSKSLDEILQILTDDVSVLTLLGDQVIVHEMGKHNLKVTLPEDLALAQYYLTQEAQLD